MIPVQQQTFTIPAGGSFPLQCNGRYFRIQAATGALKVVADTFGSMGLVGVGQGIRLRDHDPAFQRLTFVDTSGGPNIVTVVVADADFVDNSLLGTVSVVDGEKARTLAGGMFAGAPAQGAGGAGTFSAVQLWNPAGSGKNVIVSQFECSGGNIISVPAAAQLANPYASPAVNKKIGAAVGVALLRCDTLGAAPSLAGGILRNVNGASTVPWPIKGAVVIPPGNGWTAFNNAAVTSLNVSWEWFEELV